MGFMVASKYFRFLGFVFIYCAECVDYISRIPNNHFYCHENQALSHSWKIPERIWNNFFILVFLVMRNLKMFSSLKKSNDDGHWVQFYMRMYFESNIFYLLISGRCRNLFLWLICYFLWDLWNFYHWKKFRIIRFVDSKLKSPKKALLSYMLE